MEQSATPSCCIAWRRWIYKKIAETKALDMFTRSVTHQYIIVFFGNLTGILFTLSLKIFHSQLFRELESEKILAVSNSSRLDLL